ncbi:hypothetical protein [Acinetobacter sp. 161(2023)]|uniref:hypothetical protein n=1 Tax=Acinetobacter sp. 161(2023) TaxID=3098768 RepID=UPI00300B4798
MLNTIKKLFFLWSNGKSETKNEKYVQIAMSFFFLSGLILHDGYIDYNTISGDLPPHSPIIVIKGNFTKHKSKATIYIKLSGDVIYPDKAVTYYNVPYIFYKKEDVYISRSAFSFTYNFLKDHPNEPVIVYGFILENGSGNFYPLKIMNLQGMVYPSNFLNDLLSERKYYLRTLSYKIFFFSLSMFVFMYLSFKAIRENQTNNV